MCHFVITLKGGETMRTRLKQFRVGTHMTQDEFAKRLGVSRSTYAFIECGKRSGKQSFWNSLCFEFRIPDEDMFKLMKLDETEEIKCGTTNGK